MRTLPRFWKALDDVPDAATDARDWRARLGEEFDAASRFLRRTGALAEAVDCPSPGGDGCPRNVIRLPSGALRAVCGSPGGHCDAVDLRREDVAVLALDRGALATELVRAFAVAPADAAAGRRRVLRLGQHSAVAGLASPVLLALPGPRDPIPEGEFRLAGLGGERAVVLAPRPGSLPPPLCARLADAGHLLVGLSEVTGLDARGRLGLVQPVEVLLSPIREGLLGRLRAKSGAPRYPMPPGTGWRQITLTLTSEETVVCAAPGGSRQIDPGDLGMRSAKNNRPTLAWRFFVALAAANGILTTRGAAPASAIKKQKQELSSLLRRAFGIEEDPLPWDKVRKAYAARLVVRDQRPLSEREPRRRR